MSARGLFARLGLAFGLAGGMQGDPAAAQSVALEGAPAPWVAYAKDATVAITGWLNADEGPAAHMRAAMTKLRPQRNQPLPPLVLSLWVTPVGTLSKVDAAPSGNAQVDADLRLALLGRNLKTPPKDMLQPMRLAILLSDKTADQGR